MIEFRGFQFRIPKSRDYDIIVASHDKLSKLTEDDLSSRLSIMRSTAEELLSNMLIDKSRFEDLKECFDYEYDFAIVGMQTLTDAYDKKVVEHRSRTIDISLKVSSEEVKTQ